MGILKQESGYSIIESLISMTILGIIVTFGTLIINGIFSHPKALLRGEAFLLANQEIEYSLKHKVQSDTTYKNPLGNLTVLRRISQSGALNKIDVTITFNNTSEEIVTLNVYDSK